MVYILLVSFVMDSDLITPARSIGTGPYFICSKYGQVWVIAHVRKHPFSVCGRAKYDKLLGGVRKIILLYRANGEKTDAFLCVALREKC